MHMQLLEVIQRDPIYPSINSAMVISCMGGLVCCDSWGRKESDMTERLN